MDDAARDEGTCPACGAETLFRSSPRMAWKVPGLVCLEACTSCGVVRTRLANKKAFETVRTTWTQVSRPASSSRERRES